MVGPGYPRGRRPSHRTGSYAVVGPGSHHRAATGGVDVAHPAGQKRAPGHRRRAPLCRACGRAVNTASQPQRHGARGFTLVEVLVAQTCAENELVKVRLAKQMPDVGDSSIACEQAGEVFTVALAVRATPNPSFRRVDAQVLKGADSVLRLSTVVGRY